MPYSYQQVPPEVFLIRDKTTIYHCYKDGDRKQRLFYWFTTDENEDDQREFDIRDIVTKIRETESLSTDGEDWRRKVLKRGIQKGIIK